ncbi:MAG: hypothetical protein A3E85_00550 [Gammaproteobacteria bacterium RIFCSPHIGHO2_12_FULL_45_12]|nr:MAG: hypothetical protein A3E85_00550 [Gammaproteobacteria bacterium RIFCSPHIGHO2_12_FULL_45_12]
MTDGRFYYAEVDLEKFEAWQSHLKDNEKDSIPVKDVSTSIDGYICYSIQTGEVEFQEIQGNVIISYEFPWLLDPVREAISVFVKIELLNKLAGRVEDSEICRRIAERHMDTLEGKECVRNLTLADVNFTLRSISGIAPSLHPRFVFFGAPPPELPREQQVVASVLRQIGIENISSRQHVDWVMGAIVFQLAPGDSLPSGPR